MPRQREISSAINIQPMLPYVIMIMRGRAGSVSRLWRSPGLQAWSLGAVFLGGPQTLPLSCLLTHQWVENIILKIFCWRQPLPGYLVYPMRLLHPQCGVFVALRID